MVLTLLLALFLPTIGVNGDSRLHLILKEPVNQSSGWPCIIFLDLNLRLDFLNSFLKYEGVDSAIASYCATGRCLGRVCQESEGDILYLVKSLKFTEKAALYCKRNSSF